MILAIIFGLFGLYVACCILVILEEEIKRWRKRKQP